MQRIFVFLFLFGIAQGTIAQDYVREINMHRDERNALLKDTATTILKADELQKFNGLKFFPVDSSYRVAAEIIPYKRQDSIKMKTSADKLKDFILYGYVKFTLNGTEYTLNVYQMAGKGGVDYRNYLFLPFTDLTSGNESYGGGRYIDLEKTKRNTILIDFNLCYNPYCAYTTGYSCPIPPKENFLNTEIRAGEKKLWDDH